MAKTAFSRAALLALSLLLPASAAAQEPVRPDSVTRPDSAVALFPGGDAIHLGLKPVAPPFAVRFRPAPGLDRPDLWPLFEEWASDWAQAKRDGFEARRDSLWLAVAGTRASTGPDTVAYLPAPARAGRDTSAAEGILSGELGNFADLGMRISGRGEMGGAWNRFEPCDPTLALNCNPSLFPQLRPDVQFGVQVAGTVSDRVHINVDYDQRREFDAANNIHVYYQGFEDEILQRLEVGDVSFNLPSSRFLTQGIPAGNFGFKATGQIGPLDFQSVWAQQKGDVNRQEFKLGGGAGSQGLVQDLTVVRDDADYVRGQFFYLVAPDSIHGAPHFDPLSLVGSDAPASVSPDGAVAVFRYEGNTVLNPQQQGQLGYFRADGVSPSGQATHSGLWRRLYINEDFQVHPSGLWIVLRAPLGRDEALAVSYVTEAGTIVGTLDPESAPEGTVPEILLIRGPESVHQPGHVSGTWEYEMHQVYRVDASSGVERGSLELDISLGEVSAGATYALAPTGEQVPYLRLFGLDEDSPAEKVDEAQVFRPAELWGDTDNRVGGVYVVLPTLEPFRQPPPVPSVNLSAEETAQALGNAANRTIYENPDPLTRTGGARFRLNFAYRVRMEGLVSSFSLGALGIREGTDKILVNGQPLTRGADYTIDYDIGMVTLTNPDQVFAANPDAEIRATWEQKALFQLAPTSVFGLNARYALGERGELNFISMYQSEKALMSRPQLGLEPGAIFLSGVSGRYQLGGRLLDRALEAVPGLRSAGGSSADISGEIALSSPNPNTRGETFLDDFEGADEIRLSVGPNVWRLGSMPGDVTGAATVLPPILDVATAAHMTWQSAFVDANGTVSRPLLSSQIDRQINVAGQEIGEPVMYLTFGDTIRGSERQWRSMTTVLSTTGRDMSQSEYLELYVAHERGKDLALVFDVGTVSEDAFYFDSTGALRGTYPDGQPWGQDTLDQEGELGVDVWGDVLDQRGLWNQDCLAERRAVYPLTYPDANCTRGNGVRDSEDLDGNGVLSDEDAQYFRYVLELDATEHLVRGADDRNTEDVLEGTGTGFALYRIPLRGAGMPVNGAEESTWRFIKHLRMTVTGTPGVGQGPGTVLVLAKPRIVGSRWPKRDAHGILAGLADDGPGAGAQSTRLRVGPVSRITDTDYISPPGVIEQLQDPTTGFGIGGTDITEKALRLSYEDLNPDERAEIYFRYPQQPRSFLDYRTLKLWALPRAGRWGENGDQWLLVKVGTDARNHYIYRTRLHAGPGAGGSAGGADWTELSIDIEEWFKLKAEAERMLIERAASGAADTPLEPLWSEDGAYGLVLQDRFQAPNLAGVRELSFAVYNEGGTPATGEVWVNELRVGQPMRESGLAGHLDLNIRASDFMRLSASYSNESALFRRGLDGGPSYQQMGNLNLSADANLGRFAPAGWGIEMPVSVSHTRSGQDPFFLQQSDVRADRLEGLRQTGAENTRVGISIRKRTPTSNPWLSLLVDGVALSANYRTATTGAISSKNAASGFQTGISYSRQPGARELDITPGFVDGIIRAIFPESLESSELFRRLTGARLRWTPEVLSFANQYNSQESRSWRYEQILELPNDSLVTPLLSPRQGLNSNARLGFHPLESVTADISVTTTRDLLDADMASREADERQAIEQAGSSLAGMDIGWERDRSVTSQLNWRPLVVPWLVPRFGYSARYSMERTPAYLEAVVEQGDSSYVMQRQFRGQRTITRGIDLQPIGLVSATLGPEAGDGLLKRAIYGVATAFQPINLSWTSSVNSTFDRETTAPGLGYQLGLGDLQSFRFIGEGDTAKTAAEQGAFQASTGLQLPMEASVSLGYSDAQGQVFDLRGGQGLTTQRTWPDIGVRWSGVPIPAFVKPVLTSATVSSGFRRQTREETLQDRFRVDESIPLQLSLSFANGMSASYTGTLSGGTGEDPTGETEQSNRRHSLSARASFTAPGSLKETFSQPIQASLRFSRDAQRNCRIRAGSEEGQPCTPFQDFRNQSLDLTLDTVIRELSVGVQTSYVKRQSFVGQRNGSSQFQFSIFGQFNFAAGTFPTTQAPGFR